MKEKRYLDYLAHYGVKRRSGRFPWGSGDNPYQHSGDWLSRVEALKKSGMSTNDIAEKLGLTVGELRDYSSIAKNERRSLYVARAKSLSEDGLSPSEIGRIMDRRESTIRSYLDEGTEKNMNEAKATAEFLKKQIDEKGIIDVGKGAELYVDLGVSRTKFEQALLRLEGEGYPVYGIGIPQATNPGQQINVKVVCPPGTTYADAYKNDIHQIKNYASDDGGKTFHEDVMKYPTSIDPKRIQVRYAEEGGLGKDGVIELRRGVEDLSLGNSKYAQVRILVGGTHYLKGMAMYNDNLPDGVDIVFNTSKHKGTPVMGDKNSTVLKNISHDLPNNPFGSAIKEKGQSTYIGKDGKTHLSAINKINEEGDWGKWSKALSSQFLSKQPMSLIKKQLNLSYSHHLEEFDEIKSLTNPTIKRNLLSKFADECDSAARELKAAALPRQNNKVILPITSLKDNEVYAPGYRNGEKVVLIRHPHGGIFEIPELTVNNKQKEAKSLLGNAIDAIGINVKVAERLSGADFDGDTVLIIPVNNKVHVRSGSKDIRERMGLEGFEPKEAYPYKEGMPVMSKEAKGKQMGSISNLITDMTLQGADEKEIARAIRHSMVVIDAPKHRLNYKQSYIDNNIAELKKKYQGRVENGKYTESAATLISRAKAETSVPKRKGSPKINPITGEKYFKETEEYYTDAKGRKIRRTQRSTQMDETKDAFKLSSGTPQEAEYAKYANRMKRLANDARLASLPENAGRLIFSKEAEKRYSKQVSSLKAKLNTARKNQPLERQANAIVQTRVKAQIASNPSLKGDKEAIKTLRNQEIARARVEVGASGKNSRIRIEPDEWEAIQAGAIHDTVLNDILKKCDPAEVRELATPRTALAISPAKINKINAMISSGYTIAEIADANGVSTSTVNKYIKGE